MTLLETFLTTAHNQFSQIKNYHYDSSARRFVDPTGKPVDGDRLRLARKYSGVEKARAGESTLRRIIFIQSLVSSESGARPGILQQVLVGARSLVENGDLRALLRQRPSPSRAPFHRTQEGASTELFSNFPHRPSGQPHRIQLANHNEADKRMKNVYPCVYPHEKMNRKKSVSERH